MTCYHIACFKQENVPNNINFHVWVLYPILLISIVFVKNQILALLRILSLCIPFPCSDFPGGSDSKVSVYNVGDLGWEDPLEKEMAVHFSTLAWKIPWMEEPGRLQSMESQRVGHD